MHGSTTVARLYFVAHDGSVGHRQTSDEMLPSRSLSHGCSTASVAVIVR